MSKTHLDCDEVAWGSLKPITDIADTVVTPICVLHKVGVNRRIIKILAWSLDSAVQVLILLVYIPNVCRISVFHNIERYSVRTRYLAIPLPFSRQVITWYSYSPLLLSVIMHIHRYLFYFRVNSYCNVKEHICNSYHYENGMMVVT